MVREYGGSAAVRYDQAADKMVITKGVRKPMLPRDLYFKWEVRDMLAATPETEL